jgi:two-component system, OmpR family, KDP operon response regulator KdpE
MIAPILLVDDEPAIRRLVRSAVERSGQTVDEAATATEALAMAGHGGRELVLLDLGLPDRDGLELIPLFKAQGLAVIVLTARDATDEKVHALDLGADDYVTKPFDTEELLARIRVALRHRAVGAGDTVIAVGAITIDPAARVVSRDNVPVTLARKEYALLMELARFPGRVITHQALLAAVWGEAHRKDTEYLRVAVRSLRRKLEDDPAAPTLLTNDPGVGYRLNVRH